MLRACDELPIRPARVVEQAVFAIPEFRNQQDHPAAFFNKNGVAGKVRNVPDMILQETNEFTDEIVVDGLADYHSTKVHTQFSFHERNLKAGMGFRQKQASGILGSCVAFHAANSRRRLRL